MEQNKTIEKTIKTKKELNWTPVIAVIFLITFLYLIFLDNYDYKLISLIKTPNETKISFGERSSGTAGGAVANALSLAEIFGSYYIQVNTSGGINLLTNRTGEDFVNWTDGNRTYVRLDRINNTYGLNITFANYDLNNNNYSQNNTATELTISYATLWNRKNESGVFVRIDNETLYNYTKTLSNISHFINRQFSCASETGGTDTDYCTDATGGGISNSVSNLTAIVSTDGRIIITADSNPDNNKTINLTLNSNVPYNASVVHRDTLNNITDGNLSCSFITGATSNLCTLIDTQGSGAGETNNGTIKNINTTVGGALIVTKNGAGELNQNFTIESNSSNVTQTLSSFVQSSQANMTYLSILGYNNTNFAYLNNTQLWMGNNSFNGSILPNSNNSRQIGNGTSGRWAYIAATVLDVLSFTNTISYPSLTLTNSIVNADISTAAAIVYSKLSLANSIVAGDIAANAVNQSALALQSVNGSKIEAKAVNKSHLTNAVADILINYTAAGGYVSTLAQGGTNAVLTASNGAICYSTASALALSGVGSAGNILESTGANAPIWAVTSGSGSLIRTNNANLTNVMIFNGTAYLNITMMGGNITIIGANAQVGFNNGTAQIISVLINASNGIIQGLTSSWNIY